MYINYLIFSGAECSLGIRLAMKSDFHLTLLMTYEAALFTLQQNSERDFVAHVTKSGCRTRFH